MSIAIVATGVVECRCLSGEAVGGAWAVPVLLFAEGVYNQSYGLQPFVIEDAFIARLLPIGVGQTQGIAERVNLILSLVKFLLHLGVVGLPFAACGPYVEGVGIGVDEDAGYLPADDTADEAAQRLVL